MQPTSVRTSSSADGDGGLALMTWLVETVRAVRRQA
jgi:hypothetical protein